MAAKATGEEQSRVVAPANQVIEKEPSGITLSELGKKYLDHMRASGRAEKHIRNGDRLETEIRQIFLLDMKNYKK